MGREIFYCHSCGNRILEEDLRKGKAIAFLDKVYCADCKDKALDELGPEVASAPAAPPPAAARPAPAQRSPTRVRPGGPGRSPSGNPATRGGPPGAGGTPNRPSSPKIQTPRSTKMAIVIGSAVILAVLVVLLILQIRK